MKKLIGRTEIEDALKRLDKLTHEEVRMAAAQVLKVMHTVDAGVRAVDDKLAEVMDGTQPMFSKLAKSFKIHLDGKLVKSIMQRTADNVNKLSRSSLYLPPTLMVLTVEHHTPCRKPIMGRPSQMAFPPGSVHEP